MLKRMRLDANPARVYGYAERYVPVDLGVPSRTLPSIPNGPAVNSHAHHDAATASYADRPLSPPQDVPKPRCDVIDQRPIADPVRALSGQQEYPN